MVTQSKEHLDYHSLGLTEDRRVIIPEGESYLSSKGLTGWDLFKSWAFTLDHKRIGVMYLASILTFFFIGGIFALLVRAELWTPEIDLIKSLFGLDDDKAKDKYNEFFTLHGAIMVFLFIIPSMPAALGNIMLPMQLGAKDVAFPRMNLASYYLYVWGAIFFIGALLATGLDTGWTFYTPYSTTTQGPVVLATTGVFILGFSSIFTGLNFIVTMHTHAAEGDDLVPDAAVPVGRVRDGDYSGSGHPGAGDHAPAAHRSSASSASAFSIPKLGGDPVLFQHFFWFYSHPAVYIMILPGMAIISEIIPTFSRKPIFGYTFIAYQLDRHRAVRLLGVGPPHVHQRPVATGGGGLQRRSRSACRFPRRSRSSTGWRPCTRGRSV